MRLTLMLFVFVPLWIAPHFSQAAEEKLLALGAQESLAISTGSQFSVGNSDVIQVKATRIPGGGPILLVKGKSQGYSDLIVMETGGNSRTFAYRVVSKRQAAVVGDHKLSLGKDSGVKLNAQGDGWMATGQARSIDDWNKVQSLTARSKGKLDSFAKLHPMERLKAEARIQKLYRSAGLEHLKVKGVGNLILLEGDCQDTKQKELAEELAGEVFRGFRSHLKVPFENGGRLRFRARILEVLHSGAQSLGLDWAATVPNALQVSNSFSKAQFSLAAGLKILEKRGQARLISQPELLLNEKGMAELKAGGEIPVREFSRHSASVQWKPYGFLLRLELPGMSSAKARAKVTVEISSLDPANGSEGVPGLRVSRMETMVDLAVGKPVLLSGLMEKRQNRNLSLFPGLGDLPILGELFRSRDFQENQSELAILLEADEGEL
jgi:Flp pilus assembly secretin CpaC